MKFGEHMQRIFVVCMPRRRIRLGHVIMEDMLPKGFPVVIRLKIILFLYENSSNAYLLMGICVRELSKIKLYINLYFHDYMLGYHAPCIIYLLCSVFTVIVPILLFFKHRSFDGNIWVC